VYLQFWLYVTLLSREWLSIIRWPINKVMQHKCPTCSCNTWRLCLETYNTSPMANYQCLKRLHFCIWQPSHQLCNVSICWNKNFFWLVALPNATSRLHDPGVAWWKSHPNTRLDLEDVTLDPGRCIHGTQQKSHKRRAEPQHKIFGKVWF